MKGLTGRGSGIVVGVELVLDAADAGLGTVGRRGCCGLRDHFPATSGREGIQLHLEILRASRNSGSRRSSPCTRIGGTAGCVRLARARTRPRGRRRRRGWAGSYRRRSSTVDPVLDGGGRGEHQHPSRIPFRHQRPAHLVAVQSRQMTIEHDDLVAVDGGTLQRLRAVGATSTASPRGVARPPRCRQARNDPLPPAPSSHIPQDQHRRQYPG